MMAAAARMFYLIGEWLRPAVFFVLAIALVLGAVQLVGRWARVPLLAALGWRFAYRLGQRHWQGALRLLRIIAWLAAAGRWVRGRAQDAAAAPAWAVLLCEGWLLDSQSAIEEADADAARRRAALFATLAAIYVPPAGALGRLLACRIAPDAAERGLWFAARAAGIAADAAAFARVRSRLQPPAAADSGDASWLGALGTDALRSIDLLGGPPYAVFAAARHFADLAEATAPAAPAWPEPVTRLLPWLEFLARCRDWHALAAACSALLRQRTPSAELAPVSALLAQAHRQLARLAAAGSQAARYYAVSAENYQALTRDLGYGALSPSHPRVEAAGAGTWPAISESPGRAAAQRFLQRIPSWRNPGWWLAAVAVALFTAAAVEGRLVASVMQQFRHSESWEHTTPSDCALGGATIPAVGDGEVYWMVGERALARYEPSIRLWSCFTYAEDASDAPAARDLPTLSALIGPGDRVAAVRAGAAGPLLVTALGRLGMLRPEYGVARLHWLNGPHLQTLSPEHPPAHLVTAPAGEAKAALSDGQSVWMYDGLRHGWTESRPFALPKNAAPTALAVTGEAPTFWLGATSGLYFSEPGRAQAAVLLSQPISELLVLDRKATRLLAFSRVRCGSSSIGVLSRVSRDSGDAPQIVRSAGGCESVGPPLGEVLDLLDGADAVWVLTRQKLWSYQRSEQTWSSSDLPDAGAIATGWLLGQGQGRVQGRIAAVVVRVDDSLFAEAEGGERRWSWTGRITSGPFVAGSAIAWQEQGGATFWATATSPPEVIAAPSPDAEGAAQSVASAAGYLCYSGAAANPVRCIEPDRGLVRTVCDASGDCGWGGTAPTLRSGSDDTIEVVRSAAVATLPGAAAVETLAFAAPPDRTQNLPPVPLHTTIRPAPRRITLSRRWLVEELLLNGAIGVGQGIGQAVQAALPAHLRLRGGPAEPTAAPSDGWSQLFAGERARALVPERVAAMATSLVPVGGDPRGVLLATADGQIFVHSGEKFCGPRCLHPAAEAQKRHLQVREIALRDGLSKDVTLRCSTARLTPPKWECRSQRGSGPERVLSTAALFPTDRIKEVRQDLRGAQASDEADYLFAIASDGTLTAIAPQAAEPLPLRVGGWTWSAQAARETAAVAETGGPLPLLSLSRAAVLDHLQTAGGSGSGGLAFGHDRVLDAAAPPDSACSGCVYAIARAAAAPRWTGEEPEPGGAPLLMRWGPASAEGEVLRLHALPQGLAADGEAVLLAFDDRIVALEHDLRWRRAVYPLRWPVGSAVRSVSLRRVPGSGQVLAVPEPRPAAPAQLLNSVEFTPASGGAEPQVSSVPAGCMEDGRTSPHLGDRCPEDTAGATNLTLLRYIPAGRIWQGWRYRVRDSDQRFCRVASIRCNVQPPAGSGSGFAVVLGDSDLALLSHGALIGDGRRMLLPADRWVVEALAQEPEWSERTDAAGERLAQTDPLLAIHPAAALWQKRSCGGAVEVTPAGAAEVLVRSAHGCAARGRLAANPRLRLPPAGRWHVTLARLLAGLPGDTIELHDHLQADDLSPLTRALIVRRGEQLQIMPGEAIFPR